MMPPRSLSILLLHVLLVVLSIPTLTRRALLAAAQELNTDCNVGPDALAYVPAPRTCIDVEGATRCWYTYTPPAGESSSPLNNSSLGAVESGGAAPLVVDLHGFSSCSAYSSYYTGWRQKAARDGFVLMWPQGTTNPAVSVATCFDAGGCCCIGGEGLADVPDVAFLRQAIADTVASSPVSIDTRRIYLTGHSNGCMMAQRLAAQLSGIVAAVCCHAGVVTFDLSEFSGPDYNPTPIWIVHGDQDMTVPYEGREGVFGSVSAEVNIARWAVMNGCEEEVTVTEDVSGEYATHRYAGCDLNATVQLVQMYGLGHNPYKQVDEEVLDWFGDLFESTVVDTTQLAQNFCFQFSSQGEALLPPCTTCTDNTTATPTNAPSAGRDDTNPTATPTNSPNSYPTSAAARGHPSSFMVAAAIVGLLLASFR